MKTKHSLIWYYNLTILKDNFGLIMYNRKLGQDMTVKTKEITQRKIPRKIKENNGINTSKIISIKRYVRNQIKRKIKKGENTNNLPDNMTENYTIKKKT